MTLSSQTIFFNPLKSRSVAQPSLGAPYFEVNSECFAQKLRTWSKTQSFGVTKNSELRVTTKLVKIGIVLNSHTNYVVQPWKFVIFFPIGHLGLLAANLSGSPCMYSGQPFAILRCFSPPALFLVIYISLQKFSHQ